VYSLNAPKLNMLTVTLLFMLFRTNMVQSLGQTSCA